MSRLLAEETSPVSSEAGHVQISEFSKEVIPMINWQMEDLFCQYGVAMPWFMLDFDFPDYSERPDWVSGYNFNLDWGPWGYWLTWFNNLLGLLFDTANLPRWQMADLSPGSWAMYNSKMSELYEQGGPEIFIHCYDYATSDYAIWSFNRNGTYLNKWTTPEWNQENNLCVDSVNNVYMTDVAGGRWNVIKKWDKNGTLLKSKTTDYTHGIAISPDGYLYTRQLDGGNDVIVKRNLSDLTAISQIAMTSGSREFTFDSDGYFYIREQVSGDWGIGKWDYDTETRIAHHAASFDTNFVSFAYANGLIGFCCGDEAVYTIPTSLDEAQTSWSWGAIHMAGMDDYFILAESTDSDGYYGVAKYASGGVLDWTKQVGHYSDVISYGIAAYPF